MHFFDALIVSAASSSLPPLALVLVLVPILLLGHGSEQLSRHGDSGGAQAEPRDRVPGVGLGRHLELDGRVDRRLEEVSSGRRLRSVDALEELLSLAFSKLRELSHGRRREPEESGSDGVGNDGRRSEHAADLGRDAYRGEGRFAGGEGVEIRNRGRSRRARVVSSDVFVFVLSLVASPRLIDRLPSPHHEHLLLPSSSSHSLIPHIPLIPLHLERRQDPVTLRRAR